MSTGMYTAQLPAEIHDGRHLQGCNSCFPPILTKGTKVVYTDRQGVVTVGIIEKVERFRAYTDPTKIITYYAISGIGLLVPAEDDIEVVGRVEDLI